MRHSAFASLALSLAASLVLRAEAAAQVRVRLAVDEPATVLAYDEARSRAIIALPRGSFIEWDGGSWVIAPASTSGVALSAVYDLTRQRTFVVVRGATDTRLVEYDGLTAVDRGPIPVFEPRLAFDIGRGRLIALALSNGVTAVVAEWDGSAWTQPVTATSPSANSIVAVAYDENRGVTVAMFRFGVTVATWEWDGINWSLRLIETGSNFGPFAYDPTRRQVVTAQAGARAWNGTLWSSYTAQVPGDDTAALATDRTHGTVWRIGNGYTGPRLARLDNAGWSNVAPWMHVGYGLFEPRVAFHEGRGRLVVFSLSAQSRLTAEWDGFGWSAAQTSLTPSPRSQFSMVYDSARAKVVLFGGHALTQDLGDTWTWDGTWLRAANSGPPAQSLALIADDRGRGRVVLLGVNAGSGTFDRWEWDGSTWVQGGANPPWSPGQMAFGYDELRQQLALDTSAGVYSEVGGQWQLRGLPSIGAASPNLVWNPARQRLQMISYSGTIEEFDGSAWHSTGLERGEIAYDRSRDALLAFGGFELAQWTDAPAVEFDIGRGCGSATTLRAFGLPRVGNVDFHVDLRTPGGLRFAGVVLGLAPGNLPLGGGCSYYVQQEVASIVALTSDAGFLHQRLPVPALPALVGTAVMLQGAILDTQSPIGVALSPGLRLVLGN